MAAADRGWMVSRQTTRKRKAFVRTAVFLASAADIGDHRATVVFKSLDRASGSMKMGAELEDRGAHDAPSFGVESGGEQLQYPKVEHRNPR